MSVIGLNVPVHSSPETTNLVDRCDEDQTYEARLAGDATLRV